MLILKQQCLLVKHANCAALADLVPFQWRCCKKSRQSLKVFRRHYYHHCAVRVWKQSYAHLYLANNISHNL